MGSYDIIKKDKSLYFDTADDNITLSNSLYDEKSDSLYRSSISHLEFSSKFNILPNYLESYQGTRKSVLDKLRLTANDNDGDDLGLPIINSDSNQISLYDSENNNNKFNQFMKKPNENEYANSLLVPKFKSNKSSSIHHSQWKLNKLLLGHSGQVTALTIDPLNKFFVTGSSDRTMKIWDLATGELQLTLSGHIMAIRGIVISDRHPYMFSCSEDKTIKCWDLEKNKIVRDYHGHLSSVYSIDIHPTLDLIVTAGRDSAIRVWDIRTRLPVYTLTGHNNTVNQVKCRGIDPQIISCSMDSTVRTWDLIAGKCDKTLTYHSKSVRSFFINEDKKELITGSSDGIKKFNLPNCDYLQELESLKNDKIKKGNLIINSIVGNDDGVMFAGCDNGQYGFWDWDTGKIFQDDVNIPIPGSLYGEKGILCSVFDRSGLRLITGNVDKSVKIWKQVDEDL